MSQMSWVSLLDDGTYAQLNPGTALSNSTSNTDITAGGNNAAQAFTLPANFLQVGMQLRVRANGIVSTSGTPNLTLGVYLGGVAGTALATTTASATASSLSNQAWVLSADMRVEAVGSSGSIRTIGTVSGGFGGGLAYLGSGSSSGNNVTVDTSTSKILTVGAQWGTQSSSNSVQLMQWIIELLN